VMRFFFSSRRRHTRFSRDWSSDVCSSDLGAALALTRQAGVQYAPFNVQINSISPGTTMTGLQRDVTEAQRAVFKTLTPIDRFARSEERRVGKECRCSG